MKFVLKHINDNGQERWLNVRGELSLDVSERLLFENPEQCYKAGLGLLEYTTVEVVDIFEPLVIPKRNWSCDADLQLGIVSPKIGDTGLLKDSHK
jgi:hypothetical protein